MLKPKITTMTVQIDEETGETISQRTVTSAQKEVHEKYVQKQIAIEAQKTEEGKIRKKYGAFVWLLYNSNEVLNLGIKPEDLTKLIYLSTYMDYDNSLMKDDDTPITKTDMMSLLKVSENTFYKFLKSVLDIGILTELPNGCYWLNDNDFFKGSIKDKTINKSIMRLYIKGIRKLYESAFVFEHHLLSYLFRAIPFVNINYNILCHNPQERDYNKIEPMLFSEFCEKVGYKPENERKLKNKIKELRIGRTPVFNFVENSDGRFCFINPHIYYSGNKHEEVMVLGEFRKRKNRK